MSAATGAFWTRGPRAYRQAVIAALVELAAGIAVTLFVLIAFLAAPASSNFAWSGPFTMKDGRPSPLTAMLLFTGIVVVAQAGAAILLARRNAWLRVLGILVALAFASVCLFFVGAIVVEFVAGLVTGRPPSMGDQFDQIGVFASLVPATAVLVLNLRAAYFAALAPAA